MDTAKAKPVDAESVCRCFERIPQSLIEEPEVCEWCRFYNDGLCLHEEG